MPQGITNAPSTFQRLMERCVGEMNLKEVLVFIDDLIIFSSSLEEHEQRLKLKKGFYFAGFVIFVYYFSFHVFYNKLLYGDCVIFT